MKDVLHASGLILLPEALLATVLLGVELWVVLLDQVELDHGKLRLEMMRQVVR